MARSDGGGALWSPKLMVVVAFIHLGGGPTHISFGLISSELVQRCEIKTIYLFILKNML
jgi:hypothetical protein